MTTVEAVPTIPAIRDHSVPGSIIVTESDEQVRISICASLEAQGHVVVVAASLAEALSTNRDHHADLVVLDVDAPGGRDWRMLGVLREEAGPVVLITPFEDDEAVVTALQMGMHDQLSKPVRPATLVARVEAALETHRLRDALDLERKRLELANGVDALTGMHARGKMEEILAFTAAAAARYGHAMSVVLIDVDHFGRLATLHGVDAGKRVIAEVADHLAADLRKSDIAGRWDDDAFLVLLPHTDLRGAALFAERLRMTFAEMPVTLPNGTLAGMSASFGCAQGTDVSAVVEAAEARMTDAKRCGRNAVRS